MCISVAVSVSRGLVALVQEVPPLAARRHPPCIPPPPLVCSCAGGEPPAAPPLAPPPPFALLQDVYLKIVLPSTKQTRCRYIDHLAEKMIGAPQFFITHCYKANFRKMVEFLKFYFVQIKVWGAAGSAGRGRCVGGCAPLRRPGEWHGRCVCGGGGHEWVPFAHQG